MSLQMKVSVENVHTMHRNLVEEDQINPSRLDAMLLNCIEYGNVKKRDKKYNSAAEFYMMAFDFSRELFLKTLDYINLEKMRKPLDELIEIDSERFSPGFLDEVREIENRLSKCVSINEYQELKEKKQDEVWYDSSTGYLICEAVANKTKDPQKLRGIFQSMNLLQVYKIIGGGSTKRALEHFKEGFDENSRFSVIPSNRRFKIMYTAAFSISEILEIQNLKEEAVEFRKIALDSILNIKFEKDGRRLDRKYLNDDIVRARGLLDKTYGESESELEDEVEARLINCQFDINQRHQRLKRGGLPKNHYASENTGNPNEQVVIEPFELPQSYLPDKFVQSVVKHEIKNAWSSIIKGNGSFKENDLRFFYNESIRIADETMRNNCTINAGWYLQIAAQFADSLFEINGMEEAAIKFTNAASRALQLNKKDTYLKYLAKKRLDVFHAYLDIFNSEGWETLPNKANQIKKLSMLGYHLAPVLMMYGLNTQNRTVDYQDFTNYAETLMRLTQNTGYGLHLLEYRYQDNEAIFLDREVGSRIKIMYGVMKIQHNSSESAEAIRLGKELISYGEKFSPIFEESRSNYDNRTGAILRFQIAHAAEYMAKIDHVNRIEHLKKAVEHYKSGLIKNAGNASKMGRETIIDEDQRYQDIMKELRLSSIVNDNPLLKV